jgi:hypothetical protein
VVIKIERGAVSILSLSTLFTIFIFIQPLSTIPNRKVPDLPSQASTVAQCVNDCLNTKNVGKYLADCVSGCKGKYQPCGDGVCDCLTESAETCPADCRITFTATGYKCGDYGGCYVGKNADNCKIDCATSPYIFYCNPPDPSPGCWDLYPERGFLGESCEWVDSCDDPPAICGDRVCSVGEQVTCLQDCENPTVTVDCCNSICEDRVQYLPNIGWVRFENATQCPADCG